VGARGVRRERGELPFAVRGVEDRQPSLALWVEPFWRDLEQPTGSGVFAVFPINIEQHSNRRSFGARQGCAPHPAE
jgi:hypothetical protein